MGHRSPCLWLCSQPTEPYICWKALLKSFLKIQGALSRDEVHRNSDRRRETKNGSLRLAAERFSTSGTSAPFATCTSVHDRYFCMCFLCLNAQRIPPKSDSSRQSRRCWLHHNQHDRTRQKRTVNVQCSENRTWTGRHHFTRLHRPTPPGRHHFTCDLGDFTSAFGDFTWLQGGQAPFHFGAPGFSRHHFTSDGFHYTARSLYATWSRTPPGHHPVSPCAGRGWVPSRR